MGAQRERGIGPQKDGHLPQIPDTIALEPSAVPAAAVLHLKDLEPARLVVPRPPVVPGDHGDHDALQVHDVMLHVLQGVGGGLGEGGGRGEGPAVDPVEEGGGAGGDGGDVVEVEGAGVVDGVHAAGVEDGVEEDAEEGEAAPGVLAADVEEEGGG